MPRFLYGSDVHTEWRRSVIPILPDPNTYDVALLPGDVGHKAEGVLRLRELIPIEKKIVFLPGNHEYYGERMEVVDHTLAGLSDQNIHVLNPGTLVVAGVLIIGATLWSEVRPDPAPQDSERFDQYVENSINDFSVIRLDGHRFRVGDCRELNTAHRNFIREQLRLNDQKKPVIVMTHFMPCSQVIAPQYLGSALNPYYVSNCDEIMNEWGPEHWLFGHTHTGYEGPHAGSGTFLHCNPFGYPGENAPGAWKIFEVNDE